MPDLNSVPPSPHILAASRRASNQNINNPNSQPQAPPPSSSLDSSSSINILPSNQQTVNQGLSAATAPLPSPPIPPTTGMAPPQVIPGQDNTGVGAGPGPLRHPRPLTAAELHSQLEQEQELLVNRLTRDLTILRAAQNSSVVSNASSASTSTTAADQPPHASSFTDTHLMSGPGFPIPGAGTGPGTSRRHHRTSSSASARSQTQQQSAGGSSSSFGATSAPISIPQPHHSGSAASVLEAARNPRGISMSRQNSTASISASASYRRGGSRSRNHSPQPGSSYGQHGYGSYHGTAEHGGSGYFPPRSSGPLHQHQHQHQQQNHPYYHQQQQQQPASSVTSTSTTAAAAATPGSELSPGLVPATLRYEETAHYRAELEAAKRDNEALKRRIKELEKLVRSEQQRKEGGGCGSGYATTTSATTGTGTTGQGTGAGISGLPPGRSRSTSVSTTASVSVSGAAGIGGSGGGGGTGIASSRRAGVERGASTTSFVSSVAVGVSDEEVRVGESAANTAGLRGTGRGGGGGGGGTEGQGAAPQAQTHAQT